MRLRQYVTPPSSYRGKCILRFGLSDFFFHSTLALIYLFIFNESTLLSVHPYISAPLHPDRVSKHFTVSSISGYPARETAHGTKRIHPPLWIHSLFLFCYCKMEGSETWWSYRHLSPELGWSPRISIWLLEGLPFLLVTVRNWSRQQVSKQFWKGAALGSMQLQKMYSVWTWRLSST